MTRLKKLEYEKSEIERQIKEKRSVSLVADDNFVSVQNQISDYILSEDSPEVRELIYQTVGDIRVGNDEVSVELKCV